MDMLPEHALGTLAAAGRRLADETSLENALSALADAAAAAAGAEVAVVRVVDDSGRSLQARAIAARSEAVAAELVGSRFSLLELPFEETAEVEMMPAQVRAAADRVSADSLLLLPAWADGRPLGSLELMRAGSPFGSEEVAVARLAAVQLGLVLRALHGGNGAEAARLSVETSLALAGDALAAGYDPARIGDQVVRVAVTATGAVAARLWLVEDGAPRPFVDSEALDGVRPSAMVVRAAHDVLREQAAITIGRDDADSERTLVVSLRMGQPPLAVLQLFFPAQSPPGDALLRKLSAFGVRAAHALQAGRRAGEAREELGRLRALLAVLGQAIARLSLSHTLETAADQVSELMHAERVAVYLRDEGRGRQGSRRAARRRCCRDPHARPPRRAARADGSPRRRAAPRGGAEADPRAAAGRSDASRPAPVPHGARARPRPRQCEPPRGILRAARARRLGDRTCAARPRPRRRDRADVRGGARPPAGRRRGLPLHGRDPRGAPRGRAVRRAAPRCGARRRGRLLRADARRARARRLPSLGWSRPRGRLRGRHRAPGVTSCETGTSSRSTRSSSAQGQARSRQRSRPRACLLRTTALRPSSGRT